MKFYTNVQPYRNSIFLRGYIDGEPFEEKVSYKPYLFIPSKLGNTKYSTLSGDKVDRIDFDSVYDAREFYKKYSQVNNFVVYGLDKFAYTCLYDNFPGVIEYDPQQIRVLNIDIEVAADEGFPDPAVANKEVTAITMSRSGKEIIALGCQEFNPPPNVKYYRCTDEVHLLQVFINLWNSKAYCPDVVTGWNVEFFDIPYLVNRIALLLGDAAVKKLSPWKIVEPKETMLNGKLSPTYNIFGITTLDYIAMYKKFMYTKLPSYKLDYVCHVELDERKMNYEEYDSLIDLYRKNFQLFMEYNIRDVELVDKLDAKLKLLELVYAMAYDGKVNYQDCLQSIRQWDVIIHNYLLDSNIVIPPLTHNDDSTSLVGGYVKVPQVGMHNWVCSFDLTSLYPHLIMEYNISQETFAGRLQHHIGIDGVLAGRLNDIREEFVSKDCAIAANLCMYTRKKQGFLPALMERMFEDRAVYKKQMIEEKNRLEHADPNDTELCDRIKRAISRI